MLKQTEQNVIEPIYTFYDLTSNTKESLDKVIKAQEIYTGLIDLMVNCGLLYLFYQIGDESIENPLVYTMFMEENQFLTDDRLEEKKKIRERSETEYFLEDPDLRDEAFLNNNNNEAKLLKNLVDPVSKITPKSDRFSYYLWTMKPSLN